MDLAASQLIKLYMETQILIGNIYYAPTPEARLLDALNGLADMGPIKRGKFLELNNVTISHDDGKVEKLASSYVNRSTVHLAATLGDSNAGRGIGAHPGLKPYPYVEKNPLLVRLETQKYFIIGNMYRHDSQKVWNILEDTLVFLPLTQADVTNRTTGQKEAIPFVAINKEHIVSLHEESRFLKPGSVRAPEGKKSPDTGKGK